MLAFSLAPTYAQTAPVRIVVLGDSLAAGLGIKPEQSFPSRLEAALKAQGRNVAISNILVDALQSLKLKYPAPTMDPTKIKL